MIQETIIKIGTRGSKLALIQANEVADQISKKFNNVVIEIVIITTKGDIILDQPLYKIGGKELFIKELEKALLYKSIDIAVHSMKDVPAFYEKNLIIPCVLKRERANDVFISLNYKNFRSLPINARIGTSSIRRKVQIANIREDIMVVPLRGNITSRLEKLALEKNLDAIILAEAGLLRIKKKEMITEVIPQEQMLSSVGQGAICVQCRKGNKNIIKILKSINHKESYIEILAERNFMKEVNGSCTTPMAAFAYHLNKHTLHLRCMLANDKEMMFSEETDNVIHAQQMGISAGKKLKLMIIEADKKTNL